MQPPAVSGIPLVVAAIVEPPNAKYAVFDPVFWTRTFDPLPGNTTFELLLVTLIDVAALKIKPDDCCALAGTAPQTKKAATAAQRIPP